MTTTMSTPIYFVSGNAYTDFMPLVFLGAYTQVGD